MLLKLIAAASLLILGLLGIYQLLTRTPPSQPLHYVALGDSITRQSESEQTFVDMLAQKLEQSSGNKVKLENYGKSGARLQDVIDDLNAEASLQQSLKGAQLITITIGGNDLLPLLLYSQLEECQEQDLFGCLETDIKLFEDKWKNMINRLQSAASPDAIIIVMTLYNPYITSLDNPQLQSHLKNLNDFIKDQSKSKEYHVANVFAEFHGQTGHEDPVSKGYISQDSLHPSPTGHQAIADQMYQTWRRAQLTTNSAVLENFMIKHN